MTDDETGTMSTTVQLLKFDRMVCLDVLRLVRDSEKSLMDVSHLDAVALDSKSSLAVDFVADI